MTRPNGFASTAVALFIVAKLLCSPLAFSDTTMSTSVSSASDLVVRYPLAKTDRAYAQRTDYFVSLLRLALERSGVAYRLDAVPVNPVPASRNVRLLVQSKYDICWMHSSIEREKLIQPIRIPLSKGLLGWRIAFVRQSDVERYHSVRQLSDLRPFNAGQGHDWPDTRILRANGLQVITSVNRESLLAMLTHRRIDYFPRSIAEIWDEQDMYRTLNIAIDQNFAFWYPTADYFFVAKTNIALANLIEKGFEQAIADGSYDAAFNNHYSTIIEQSKLATRQLFILDNPYIPPETPLYRPELWYIPKSVTPSAL